MAGNFIDPFDDPNFVPGVTKQLTPQPAANGFIDPFDDPKFTLKETAAEAPPKDNAAASAVKNFATGAAEGASGTLGFTGDAREFVKQKALDVGEFIGRELFGFTDEDVEKTRKRIADADDSVLGKFAELVRPTTSDEIEGTVFFGDDSLLGAEKAEAKTAPDRLARDVGQFVGAGPVKGMQAINVASGTASFAAGELTGGTTFEPYARALAALVAGGGVAAVKGSGGRSVKMAKEAMEGVSEAELKAATALQRTAKDAGVNLTAPEAIAQVQTNPSASPLLALMGDVSSSRRGGAVVADALKTRGKEVQEAATKATKDAVGTTKGASPATIGDDVQAAAQGLIDDAVKARSKASGPHFEAAKGDAINPRAVQIVADNMRKQAQQFDAQHPTRQLLEGIAGRLTPGGKPITNAGKLNEIFKQIRDVTLRTKDNPNALDKGVSATVGKSNKQLRAVTQQSPNIKRGREIHKDLSKRVVEPLEKSQIGALAKTKGGPEAVKTARRILLDPENARPIDIENTLKGLANQNKEATRKLAATFLERALDKSLKGTQAGDKTMAGVKFKQRVMGTPQQEENLKAIIMNTPGTGVTGAQRWDAFKKVMDVLDATGKLPKTGSQTAGRQANLAEAGRAGVIVDNVVNPVIALRAAAKEMIQGRNLEKLAKIFTRPDSVSKLREIAKLRPDNAKAQFTVAEALGLTRETKRKEQPKVRTRQSLTGRQPAFSD